MSIVKFYRGDPNAPKTTMPAHLGANVILTCKGRLLLEKRRDSDTWGLVGGGVKKTEEPIQAIAHVAGVPTPKIDAIVTLARTILGEKMQVGRNAETMGIAGLTKEQLLAYING